MTWRAFVSMPTDTRRLIALLAVVFVLQAVVAVVADISLAALRVLAAIGWLYCGVLYTLDMLRMRRELAKLRFAETIQAMSRHLLTCEACDKGPCQVARELSERILQSAAETGRRIERVEVRTSDLE